MFERRTSRDDRNGGGSSHRRHSGASGEFLRARARSAEESLRPGRRTIREEGPALQAHGQYQLLGDGYDIRRYAADILSDDDGHLR